MTTQHVHVVAEDAPALDKLYRYFNSLVEEYKHVVRPSASVESGNVLFVPGKHIQVANELWLTYLATFQESHRQQFNCHECRRWFVAYAPIQIVDWNSNGVKVDSLFFRNDPEAFAQHGLSDFEIEVINRLGAVLQKHTPGQPVFERNPMRIDRAPGTEQFDHFYCTFGIKQRYLGIKTVDQYRASKSILSQFLNVEIKKQNVDAAVKLFTLDRDFVGYANYGRMLRELAQILGQLEVLKHRDLRSAYLSVLPLMEVARYRSGLIGSFLLKLESDGMEAAKRLFVSMVDPSEYRKPSALPHSEQVALAERLIEARGWQNSLKFDLAKVDNPLLRWAVKYQPQVQEQSGGLFSGIETKDRPTTKSEVTRIDLGGMSFEKAWDLYLTKARSVEVMMPRMAKQEAIAVVSVAQNPEAPPIMQHDVESDRYPVAIMALEPRPTRYQIGLCDEISPGIMAVPIVGFMEIPNTSAPSEVSPIAMVYEVKFRPPFQLQNPIPPTLKEELHDYWRVIYHYGKQHVVRPDVGDAMAFLIPRQPGVVYEYSAFVHLHLTLEDGTLAQLHLTSSK